MPLTDDVPNTDLLDNAWKRYRDGIESLRGTLHGMELARTRADHVAADRWLIQAQAAAHNLVMTPNLHHPTFIVHNVFEPNVYNWLLPNPDFLYRYAFVDGASSYRIRGTRQNAHFLDAQVISGFWGDSDMKMLESYSFDDFERGGDGGFEVHVGPEPDAQTKAWIRTDPEARRHTLLVRECFNEWESESPSDLMIERVATGTENEADFGFVPSEAETIDRLEAALRMIEFCHHTFSGQLSANVVEAVGYNQFLHLDTSRDEDAANPVAGYVPAVYDLAPDEALLIEFEVPRASYWSLQVGDVWLQSADFVHHQSSLNGSQVEADTDGRARIVLSARDPGVANWLDSAGNDRGVVLVRWYHAETHPVPEVRRMPIAEVLDSLPPKTPRITSDERARRLTSRREAIERRYGRRF